jgi:hypothetical protein
MTGVGMVITGVVVSEAVAWELGVGERPADVPAAPDPEALTERLESFDVRAVRANEEPAGRELVADVLRLVER